MADPWEKRSRGGSGLYTPPSYNSDLDRPAWRTGQRSRYLKLGGALALVLLVLYVLSPGEKARDRQGQATMSTPKEVAAALKTSLTTKCTRPYDSSKDLIQYALMIDAGSTGSRIHVYRFNNCGPTPELEDELFKQTEKKKGGSGLSSYDSDAEGAAASLDVLLDAALEEVPKEYRSCSPVALKATAGLRKLGEEKSDKILKAVRKRLETKYPFPVLSHERGGVEVMEGTDEGVYAWITVNYLLGKIGGPDKNPTAAVLDLGGGSTQIVLEPTFPRAHEGGMPQQLEPGDHRYELDFGARNFTLYQHSYLGYGLMAAREAIHQVAVLDRYQAGLTAERNREPGWEPSDGTDNPCIQPGQTESVTVPMPKDHALGESVKTNMRGVPGASPEQCLALVERMLHKNDVECKLGPCSFNGVYQPSLREVYAREAVYLFSYFYDRLHPLGMPDTFKLQDLADMTNDVCAGEQSKRWARFSKVDGALEELRDRPEHCLDLSYMLVLLSKGYEMPMDRELHQAKKLQDRELGWCLGASLPLLDGNGWTCKLSET